MKASSFSVSRLSPPGIMQAKESRTGGHRVNKLPMHIKSDATEEFQPLESLITVEYHPKMTMEDRAQRILRSGKVMFS